MTDFDTYIERNAAYEQKVHGDGDLLWWETPDRCAKVAARLGLPVDTRAPEVRKALFEKGRHK
jgi:hypothetical protein